MRGIVVAGALCSCKVAHFFIQVKEKEQYLYNYAIVAIVKNEALYIKEWIDYHSKIGVQKFYIYDNDSDDNLLEVLSEYIEQGLVDLILYSGSKRQCHAYNDAIERHKYECKYIAAIDIDEFILPLESGHMDDFDRLLSQNYSYGGIAIHWCCFGSAGHVTKPQGSVLESYCYRASDDYKNHIAVKTIFNPRKVIAVSNPHFACYVHGVSSINENKHKVEGALDYEVTYDKFRINHYFCKSQEECQAKFNRGMADVSGKRQWDKFVEYDRNEIYDNTINHLLERIS